MSTQSKLRILIVRLSAMGDVLHALPAVTALRLAHPEWQIDWVIEPRWRALLSAGEACIGAGDVFGSEAGAAADAGTDEPHALLSMAKPLSNRIYLAPTKAWGKRPISLATASGIWGLRRQLRDAEFDAVVDLQGSIRSALIAQLTGCRRVIGAAHPREKAARWLYTECIETHCEHVIEQAVELASALAGDDLVAVPPLLPRSAQAESWCDELLSERGVYNEHRVLSEDRAPSTVLRPITGPVILTGPIILINPGAGWGAKRWPAERYTEVAQQLAAEGARVLVNAGPGEESLAAAVAARHGTVVSGTLEQLIALTRRVDLVIAGDTGPLHLACALGRPVVAIFGPTDPRRNGPFGTRSRVLRSPLSQRDHRRHAEPEAGLLTISAASVLEAARELLQSQPSDSFTNTLPSSSADSLKHSMEMPS